MTVLLGFAALVVDIGLNWATRTSAQTAADSAALAGASVLLVDGPAAAILEVQSLLADNIDGLTGVAGWATDGIEANGEVDCWTLPDDPPPTSEPCLDGSNALQVITPPIEVQYAFAPVLGKASNSIKALAAAGVGPAAPNNCVLCLLDTGGASRLAALGPGRIEAIGGGIVVNSNDPAALVSVNGDIERRPDPGRRRGRRRARRRRHPPTARGGGASGGRSPRRPAHPGPAGLPGRCSGSNTALIITIDTTLLPGIYTSVTVTDGATLTLDEGVYVFRTTTGLTIEDDSTVVSSGDGVTIYLGCASYPVPCSGAGARFRVQDDGEFLAAPPTGGEYAGLSIFADPGNTRFMRLRSSQDLTLDGALYGASMPVRIEDAGDLTVDSLLVAGSLATNLLSSGSVVVDYDPTTDILGLARPVLIR